MAKKRGKRYLQALEKVDRQKLYDPEEALALVKEIAPANFDETIEVSAKLGVNPKHADQQVRGAIVLPRGTGKEVKVAVFAQGEKMKEAEAAGADYVGGEELAQKIEQGWMDFDAVVSTPDMMRVVGKLGRILGPKGLMPSPKVGTVTFDLEKAIKDLKAGKVEYRVDKTSNIHVPVGKVSFEVEALMDNFLALMDALIKARPAAAKGKYLRTVAVTSTMGPGIKVDPQAIVDLLGKKK